MSHPINAPEEQSRLNRLTVALFIAMTSLLAPAAAQDASPSPSPTERIYLYLDSVVYVRPGRGLETVVIGTPLEAVVQAWGPPFRSDRSGIINRRTTLLYKAGINSWIRLVGDRTVEEIGIEGQTELSTPEGVRFGMPTHQVKLIYGEPVVTDEGTYRYPERGIAFAFRSGLVYQIEVFAPESRE
jgi:hypothetical protein